MATEKQPLIQDVRGPLAMHIEEASNVRNFLSEKAKLGWPNFQFETKGTF
jgi:hypothetical protein